MNKKLFSGIIVSSVISISACQAEKREKIEINQNDQNPEKILVIQSDTQKSVVEKLEKFIDKHYFYDLRKILMDFGLGALHEQRKIRNNVETILQKY